MWKGEDCLGCPIGSMSYRHSLLILCTPLPRHTPGIPRQRPNQQKTGKKLGKKRPIKGKKRNQGLLYELLTGEKELPRLLCPVQPPGEGSAREHPASLRGLRRGEFPAPPAPPAVGTTAAGGALPF